MTDETGVQDSELPVPCGYKLLIALPKVDEKSEGGIYKPEDVVHREQTASIIGLVLDMGPDAYKDPSKFPHGPWCKQGDYILMRSYSGTRFRYNGAEFRLINDDTVEAVVPKPDAIRRVDY